MLDTFRLTAHPSNESPKTLQAPTGNSTDDRWWVQRDRNKSVTHQSTGTLICCLPRRDIGVPLRPCWVELMIVASDLNEPLYTRLFGEFDEMWHANRLDSVPEIIIFSFCGDVSNIVARTKNNVGESLQYDRIQDFVRVVDR